MQCCVIVGHGPGETLISPYTVSLYMAKITKLTWPDLTLLSFNSFAKQFTYLFTSERQSLPWNCKNYVDGCLNWKIMSIIEGPENTSTLIVPGIMKNANNAYW